MQVHDTQGPTVSVGQPTLHGQWAASRQQRPCLRQHGRPGPTYKIVLWPPHTWPCVPQHTSHKHVRVRACVHQWASIRAFCVPCMSRCFLSLPPHKNSYLTRRQVAELRTQWANICKYLNLPVWAPKPHNWRPPAGHVMLSSRWGPLFLVRSLVCFQILKPILDKKLVIPEKSSKYANTITLL